MQQAIDAAMTGRNPKLRLFGYMLTMYNRQLGIHKAYEKLLREQYGDLVLETVFPLATAFKEAVSRRHPISVDSPSRPPPSGQHAFRRAFEPGSALCRSRRGYYYAGNRYVPGVAEPQDPMPVETQSEEAA